jgi:outer membrane biosynthesis protein TonB
VSLILEALKKLEREKKTPERGFLVTAGAAWPARSASPALLVLAGVAVAGVIGLAGYLLLGRRPDVRQAAAPATAAPGPPTQPAPQAAALTPAPALATRPTPAPAPAASPVLSRPAPRPTPRASPAKVEAEAPTPEPTPGELRLEALSKRDGQPIAVVSGRLVREGDAFDNVRVLRIGEGEVELEVDGQRRVLRF